MSPKVRRRGRRGRHRLQQPGARPAREGPVEVEEVEEAEAALPERAQWPGGRRGAGGRQSWS